ncbi:hypothetical protein BDF20DRAFT_141122 [Mycotypha africana]|uniref:uncharacterized protein n=1 Tax=Mycotypha africana TaxID=64632 RepID=UPI002300E5CD|nr:uncharacterized protein BDF20DRAFT_141122 [Mycotypha africana]KAI8969027.1 hypothetical protein BDF20DRAFT_141122 [Mycotypha africana]
MRDYSYFFVLSPNIGKSVYIMSDEEEDDYMSLKFLQDAEQFESQRKEATYTERRKKQLREQEKKAHVKPRAQLEAEERGKALQRSLEEDKSNKGMKMLMKMGFKKGMSLGKNSSGIVEPIKVNIKAGRQGIGMEIESEKRLRALEEEEMENSKRAKVDLETFRTIKAKQAKENQLRRYLTAAISICKKFDEENSVETNILWTLEPASQEMENNEDTEQDKEEEATDNIIDLYPKEEIERLNSLELDEKFALVVEYLRNKYFYCFWCSAKYKDAEDLQANCPGPEEDDH